MKKIVAILTRASLGTNYGNTVQAYALQTVLKKAGFEPMVLDRVKYNIYKVTHWSLSQIKNVILNFIDKKNRSTPRIFNQIFKEHLVFQGIYQFERTAAHGCRIKKAFSKQHLRCHHCGK